MPGAAGAMEPQYYNTKVMATYLYCLPHLPHKALHVGDVVQREQRIGPHHTLAHDPVEERSCADLAGRTSACFVNRPT